MKGLTKHKARGIRNNNPGNIERGAPWKGLADRSQMTPNQRGEARFCVFVAPEYGVRAIGRIIQNYRHARSADGTPVDTIAEIIARWAPASENDTRAYVAAVDAAHPKTALDAIDPHSLADMVPLVEAIIHHENGAQPYPRATIEAGLVLAGCR